MDAPFDEGSPERVEGLRAPGRDLRAPGGELGGSGGAPFDGLRAPGGELGGSGGELGGSGGEPGGSGGAPFDGLRAPGESVAVTVQRETRAAPLPAVELVGSRTPRLPRQPMIEALAPEVATVPAVQRLAFSGSNSTDDLVPVARSIEPAPARPVSGTASATYAADSAEHDRDEGVTVIKLPPLPGDETDVGSLGPSLRLSAPSPAAVPTRPTTALPPLPIVQRHLASAAGSMSTPARRLAGEMSFASMFTETDEATDGSGFTTVEFGVGAAGPAAAPPPPTVQRQADAAPPAAEPDETAAPAAGTPAPAAVAPASGAPASGASAGADVDELARRLFEPLSARLRAELWLDRERAGLVTDVRP